MKIVVMGGGLIGSNIVPTFREHGHEVPWSKGGWTLAMTFRASDLVAMAPSGTRKDARDENTEGPHCERKA